MSDKVDSLGNDVRALSGDVRKLIELMNKDYPRRGEVERRFVTKFSQQKFLIKVLAAIVIAGTVIFAGTIGSFSLCLVGDSNPGICKIVPGYDERVERRDLVDKWNEKQDRKIARIEKQLGLKPMPDGDAG